MDRYSEMLKDYIHDNCHQMTREPSGILRYPYTVPCSPQSPYYAMSLWDWDSWLISIVLGQVEVDLSQPGRFFAHEQGAILNFLDHADTKGRVPIHISEQGQMTRRRPGGDKPVENMHKPVLAQHAAALVWRSGKIDWLLPVLPKIEAFLNRYEADYTQSDTGLLIWVDDFAVGVDNDPSVYYRPDSSCGSIYLNSLYYRELLAFAALMERSGNNSKAVAWRAKAGHLANAINAYCWDERDGTYYSVDFALRAVDSQDWLHQGAPRSWPCLLLRIDSWSSFLPLWAGLASPEQAERMVQRMLDPATFCCRFGLRTLSRQEKMYALHASNNPSNWLGPVWGISNYMAFAGLLRYGYREEAIIMAKKTIDLFGGDLEKHGCLHEYYHPDTGEPIMTPFFQNWNFLVLNMIAFCEDRRALDCF